MLEKKNALPGSKSEVALVDRYDLACSRQSHSQMTGTVIGPFVGVDEVGEILGD